MYQRRALFQRLSPDVKEFLLIKDKWRESAFCTCLGYLWIACDSLEGAVDKIGGVCQEDVSIERSLTQYLVPLIRKAKPAVSPFGVEHGLHEFESLKDAKAQPPQYDIGFYLLSTPACIWPIEAKVLRTERTVDEYAKSIVDDFTTCRYAPITAEGGMLGYLIEGDPAQALRNVAVKLHCRLRAHPDFKTRNHGFSTHHRQVPAGKDYSSRLRCHHMVVLVGNGPTPKRKALKAGEFCPSDYENRHSQGLRHP